MRLGHFYSALLACVIQQLAVSQETQFLVSFVCAHTSCSMCAAIAAVAVLTFADAADGVIVSFASVQLFLSARSLSQLKMGKKKTTRTAAETMQAGKNKTKDRNDRSDSITRIGNTEEARPARFPLQTQHTHCLKHKRPNGSKKEEEEKRVLFYNKKRKQLRDRKRD